MAVIGWASANFNKMKKLKMWYSRWFKVIDREQAIKWGLSYQRSIYGDEINTRNCRSIWMDKNGNLYRVESLQ
jgi:hypothetical protein